MDWAEGKEKVPSGNQDLIRFVPHSNILSSPLPLPPQVTQSSLRLELRGKQRNANPKYERAASFLFLDEATVGAIDNQGATEVKGGCSHVSSADMNSFLSLVPRGLQYAAQDILRENLAPWEFEVRVRGERQHPTIDVSTLTTTLQANNRNPRNRRSRDCIDTTCLHPAGVVKVDSRDVAIGYECYSCGDEESSEQQEVQDSSIMRRIWSEPGQLRGLVWLELVTSAPVDKVLSIRCLGPLLVLVQVCDDDVDLGDSKQSLVDATMTLRALLEKHQHDYTFGDALLTWQECRKCLQNMSKQALTEVTQDELNSTSLSLRFRLSCLRDDSKKYAFSREQLLTEIVGSVIPSNDDTKTWSVDLKNFDLEVVLLLRPNALAIGFSVHDYPRYCAKSFSAGVIPPDPNPPYLSGQVLSGIVRLRPSTAQLLLKLASLQEGDILLDPCAGIGTIPLETMLPGTIPVVAMGGDVVLSPPSPIISIAVRYQALVRSFQRANHPSAKSTVMQLVGLDAGYLPFRDESVDAVVSDLPFGQQCLSSAKLDSLIPLLIGELSRVLRRNTGRMLLLCGSHVPILKALQDCNARNNAQVWQLPCSAVFPVNIGGFLAWIIRVKRGSSESARIHRHIDRARKLTKKREMSFATASNSKSHRLQS